eukprot:PhM_4_TR11656/c5_g2_i10/m.16424
MRSVFLTLALLVALSAATTTRWHDLEAKSYNHDMYVAEFNKVYADASEHKLRKAAFERNLAAVHSINRQGLSWKAGVNHLTDRTDEELKAMRGYRREMAYASRLGQSNKAVEYHKITGKAIPDSLDYRQMPGVVSPVKDQGKCGSCWTFSTVESIESWMFLALNKSTELSEQQVASCTSNPMQCGGTGGCEGGTPEVAYESIIKNGGIASYSSYPYSSYFGTDAACKFADNKTVDPVVKLSGYKRVKSNDYDSLMDAVANVGPIAISVDASTWQSYESGIYDGCNQDSPAIDHAVQLVGYGEEAGKPYWIVRNSWAASWGENGFIRLFRDIKPRCGVDTDPSQGDGCKGGPSNVTVCGTCGILSDSSYPIIEKN